MKRSSPRCIRFLLVTLIVLLPQLLTPNSAVALGDSWNCNVNQAWYGSSGSTWGRTKSSYCQTKFLSLTYELYPGSPTYTTGWYYSELNVYVSEPIVLYSTHKVWSCVYPYTCGPLKTYP